MDHLQDREARWHCLQAQMEEARAWLSRSGAVVTKQVHGAPAAFLRFNTYEAGRRRQRSIHVGIDPILIERVRRLLDHFRTVARWDHELETAARKLRPLVARLKRPHRKLKSRHLHPGAIRAKRQDILQRATVCEAPSDQTSQRAQ
jgi:hypothetical protein